MPYALGGVAKLLELGQRLRVYWRFPDNAKEYEWHGEVLKTDPLELRYDEALPSERFTLPPVHDIRIRSITILPRRNVFFQRTQLLAEVGGYLHIRFSSGENVVGIIIWKARCVCKIKVLADQSTFMFPPPPNKAKFITKFWFVPACPVPIAIDHRSTHVRFVRATEETNNDDAARLSESTADNVLSRHESRKASRSMLHSGQMKICTVNVRTLCDPPRLHTTCAFALHFKIDIVVLTETRRSEAHPAISPGGGWVFVEEPATQEGHGGVGVLLSPVVAKAMKKVTTVLKNRIISIQFDTFTVIAVYMPTAQCSDKQEQAYNTLSAFLSTFGPSKKYAVVGDMNARPLCQAKSGVLISAANRLEDLLSAHSLSAANVDFKDIGTLPTHKNATLDYILTAPSMVDAVCTKLAPVDTDHKALIVTMSKKWTLPPKRSQQAKPSVAPDLRALSDPNIEKQFSSIADLKPCTALLACSAPTDWITLLTGNSTYLEFSVAVQIAKSILPPMKKIRKKTHWQNDALRDLIKLNDATGAVPHSRIITLTDALDTQEHTRLLLEFSAQLRNNPRLAWKCVAATQPQSGAQLPADTPEQRNELFHAHFRKLFETDEAPPEMDSLPPPTRTDICWQTGPFTDDEITEALRTVQNGKSVGIDGIPNEILKLPTLRETVTRILHAMQEEMLPEQRTSALVPLPKKGDLSVLGNWRGISLMPHITKLFDKLLLHRVRKAVDDHLNPAQNGFRQARGTVHHVAAAISILEMVETTKKDLHGCFVDFSKAFDSVKWSTIAEQLRYWNAPDDFLHMVFSVMVGHVIRVRTDGLLSADIPVGVGVLQGDTLAPYLFILVMDSILRALDDDDGVFVTNKGLPTKRQKAMGKTSGGIPALGFADDVLLVSHQSEGLQRLLTTFESQANRTGLKLNMGKGKTERFVIKKGKLVIGDKDVITTLSGAEVPAVTDYKYLGINILDYEKDFKRRKGMAWAAVSRFKGTWKSNAPWDVKRALFSALVEPLLTYGIIAWPMTAKRSRELDGLHARLLRTALGLPPAAVSRSYAPTEHIYGNLPFLSEQIAQRRITFFGHAAREHTRGKVHRCVQALLHTRGKDDEWNGGGRVTMQRQLMRDFEVDHVSTLAVTLEDRQDVRETAVEAAGKARAAKIRDILKRRPPGYVYPDHQRPKPKAPLRPLGIPHRSVPQTTVAQPALPRPSAHIPPQQTFEQMTEAERLHAFWQ